MLFGAPPEFHNILQELKDLEAQINAMAHNADSGST